MITENDGKNTFVEEFESLNLKSRQEEQPESVAIDLSDDAGNTSDISLDPGNQMELTQKSHQEVLATIKNENYHLRLALDEKENELSRLKKLLDHENFIRDTHSLLCEPFEYGVNPKHMVSKLIEGSDIGSPTKHSISDSEFVSHISHSPYKGNRARSLKTESSLASSKLFKLKGEAHFFYSLMMSFIQTMTTALKGSMVFRDEAIDLGSKLNDLLSNNEKETEHFTLILNRLEFCFKQMIALLNRELHFKKISQRLEFLFTVFLDPEEYNLQPQEHIEKLKDEIMDTLITIFDHETEPQNGTIKSNHNLAKVRSDLHGIHQDDDFFQRLRHIEEGIDLCAETMQQVYGGRDPRRVKATSRMTYIGSSPSTKSDSGILGQLSDFNNRNKDKEKLDKLEADMPGLEFIPIGYDENTPSKAFSFGKIK